MATTTTTTSTSTSTSSSSPPAEEVPARTVKREPGKITKAIKLGVVGDGTVGKTTLLMAYTLHAFLDEYTPTVFDSLSVIEEVDDKLVNIILWDTAGQEDYKQLRTTTYQNTDIFLLCFSVVHPSSFDNVKWWLEELKEHCPNTPFLLCGTKADLRDDESTIANLKANNEVPITRKRGKEHAKKIKAKGYIECSSRDVPSVTSVFIEAVKIVMDKDRKYWSDVHKKAKKEDKIEAKLAKKVDKKKKDGEPLSASGSITTSSSSATDE